MDKLWKNTIIKYIMIVFIFSYTNLKYLWTYNTNLGIVCKSYRIL